MDQILAWAKALVLWFKNPVKLLATLAILAALAIFTPTCLQVRAGTEEWRCMHLVLAWGVFLFGTIFTGLSGLQKFWSFVTIWNHLQHLPSDEQRVLAYYIKQNIHTHTWFAAQSEVSTLECKGILLPLNSHAKARDDGYFNDRLRPWIFRYLQKRPTLLS